ncbi:hypothetical protein LTR04_000438 [Oleoguttula sp. CCFEE 6159]|nr:hypothetical protein LTR04_000438 [Oleoguttula sp. CCFEE 6159]
MAVASKHLAATYNRPGFEVVTNHTWCMVGDACLQEGVALEAISLAGHWRSAGLTIIYDNNQVTCDGSVDLCNTEDVSRKMEACGWDVVDIEDRYFDIRSLVKAMRNARNPAYGRPTFINVRTIIGLGSKVAGDVMAHGAAFGVEDVAQMKEAYGFDPQEHLVVFDKPVRAFFQNLPSKGQLLVSEWNDLLRCYEEIHPELAANFKRRVDGTLPEQWKSLVPTVSPKSATPSRKSSGMVLNPIAKEVNNLMVGTADLTPSVNMSWERTLDFQSPNIKTTCGINGDYTGCYIRYGIREHAMAAIPNGLAA